MKEIQKLPLFSREDGSVLYAVAEPQVIFKPSDIWIDGERFELPPREAITPGQILRERLPASAKKTSLVAIGGKGLSNDGSATLGTSPVQGIDIIVGCKVMGKSVADSRYLGVESPANLALLRTGTFIADAGATATVNPYAYGRIVGMEVNAIGVCGTCYGIGKVGMPHHEVRCPTCAGEPAYRTGPVKEIFVTDLRCGARSQMVTAGAVPVAAFRDRRLELDALHPGQLFSVSLVSASTQPVELTGHVLFQELEYTATPPAPPFGGGGPIITPDMMAPKSDDPKAAAN
jgi:hypothetical protein